MTMQGGKPSRFKRNWHPQTPPQQLRFLDEEKCVEEKSEKLDKPYDEEGVLAENSRQSSI